MCRYVTDHLRTGWQKKSSAARSDWSQTLWRVEVTLVNGESFLYSRSCIKTNVLGGKKSNVYCLLYENILDKSNKKWRHVFVKIFWSQRGWKNLTFWYNASFSIRNSGSLSHHKWFYPVDSYTPSSIYGAYSGNWVSETRVLPSKETRLNQHQKTTIKWETQSRNFYLCFNGTVGKCATSIWIDPMFLERRKRF